jgi:hypothetical protein
MVKCSDGRKHVLVKGYQKKTGKTISRYERSCPTRNVTSGDEEYTCCVCGEGIDKHEVLQFPMNGEIKTICTGCADTIHGLL